MHAIVLAAGDGGRLHALTAGLPKPLFKVQRRRLINHVLDALFEAGVLDTTIVIGYRGEEVRAAVESLHPEGMRVRFVWNHAYELGNARSLWAARDAFDARFVLAMSDHLIAPGHVRALTAGAGDRCRLAIECAAPDDPRRDEATLALVRNGRIIDLGKGIGRWNALDTGVFWCTRRVFDVLTPEYRDGEAGAVFARLARAGELDAVDVTGAAWVDVDTPEDAQVAETLLARAHTITPGPRDEVA